MTLTTVGKYLVNSLPDMGIKHVFGVPGDYVLDLMDRFVDSPMKLINTSCELGAGYAADGYSRVNGLAALVVTYGVGGLSAFNAVAGAYAERVPLVVISGAPHSMMRNNQTMMHHLVGHYSMQLESYRQITEYAVMLSDGASAPDKIDEALDACLRSKRPVYIEVPVDVVDQLCRQPLPNRQKSALVSNPDALNEAVREAAEMLKAAKKPAIFIGMEIRRFKLGECLMQLLEKSGYPVATTIGGKSGIPENHPHYIGVYQGGFSLGTAHDIIEEADALLCLGAWMTDMTTGGFTAHIDPGRMISANSEIVKIKHHFYNQVILKDFIEHLTNALKSALEPDHFHTPTPYKCSAHFIPVPQKKMTVKRFFERLNQFLDNTMLLVCDTGDVIFGGAEMYREQKESHFSQDYYLSIGYSLPAGLGVALAAPDKRTVVLIGDGALQMTVQELGSHIRFNTNALIFVLNNNGYLIERLIHDGPYNEIQTWQYARLPDVFGGGYGVKVCTEDELELALQEAKKRSGQTVVIEIVVDKMDSTDTLALVGKNVRKISNNHP